MSNVYIVQTANITVSPCRGVTADGVANFGKDWAYGSAVDLHPDDAVSLLRAGAVKKAAAMPEASEKTPEFIEAERLEALAAKPEDVKPEEGATQVGKVSRTK